MKLRAVIKFIVLGAVIVAIGGLLRGHDVLTGLALSLLFLVVAFKMGFALTARRRCGFPPTGGGDSADRPESRPPGGRPPVLSAAERVA